ncbi:hypothetical protein FBU30_003326 [Linnemannia zychae]|nr:hypothetical protein FBU30_003326 [Linnemannia zychae]
MQTSQQQQQQQYQQHMQQQQQQQRASAMQAAGRMPNGRHGSFEMGQPSQGWGYGSGPMPGMNQARPPMSGFPSMMQSSMLQQQQHQQQQQNQSSQQQLHSHPSHQQEILDMSDFPALGSVNNASSNPGLSAASYASTAGTLANSNVSASANGLTQEFSIEDDFPALPGARPNSANSSRHFGSMQMHQQQQQASSRNQQGMQHHPTQQQQAQHILQQSQLDGMGSFSSMISPTSGSQMQQSMQLQQQMANDMMFQQQQQQQQQQSLAQQQLLHLNGSHSPLSGHLAPSTSDLGKTSKVRSVNFIRFLAASYANKAGNASGLFSTLTNSPAPTSSSTANVSTAAGGPNVASQMSTTQPPSGANVSVGTGTVPVNAETGDAQNRAVLDDHDRFGLFGMLGVIRMADQDATTLTLGRDLTTLGLSLNSAEPLHGTFVSPWFEGPASSDVEAEFHVPACYNVQPPPPVQAKLGSVLDETLFYMFYSMPRDALQDAAAVELYNRQWRYHKELRLWLMKDQSSEPSKTPTFERGSYIFFDPNSWEKVKKDFIVMYDALEDRRQVPGMVPNGNNATNVLGAGGAAVGGNGPMANAGNMVNGMEGGNHAGLLNSLNMTATPGPASVQSHLKQGGAHGGHSFQQQQVQQQRQQQQAQQKSLQMMNMASAGHVPYAPNNSNSNNSNNK